MIKVVFFAALREQLNCAELSLNADDSTNSIAKVKQLLVEQNPQWQETFNNASLLSAVNHEMVDNAHPVKAGDEVAFFPPVTGG